MDYFLTFFPDRMLNIEDLDTLSLLFSDYAVFNSLDSFPQVSLNFAGGASLVLGAQDYLIKQNYIVSF